MQDKYLAEFDFICQTVADCYSYLTIKQQRYEFSFGDLTTRFRERLDTCKSDEEYIKIVREYLKSFHDGHLRLVLTDSSKNSPPKEPAISNNWDSENRNILVVRVRRLWDKDEVKKSFAETLSLAKNSRGILFDLRNNGGGDDALAFDLFRKLIPKTLDGGRYSIKYSKELLKQRPFYETLYPNDPQRPGYSIFKAFPVEPEPEAFFNGPIAVVANKGCYSSCESMVVYLRFGNAAKVFGTRTGGGSGNPIFIDLPQTKGQLMVPTWIHVMPNGELLEDNGVPPNEFIEDEQQALAAAMRYLNGKQK
jgi:C-terminal processing protease CtpA/Prc